MFKYLIEFTRFNASVIVEYNEAEQLIYFKANYEAMEPEAIVFLLKRMPGLLSQLEYYKQLDNVKVTLIPFDSSFDTFWDTYSNKFGNKSRSEKLWNALSEQERIKAIKHIQAYNQWLLMNTGVQKKLPETYLNQQSWNN